MSVTQRRVRRMKHRRIQRSINRMSEHLWEATFLFSGLPDIRKEVEEILEPFQSRPSRRPLRLTRSRW